MDNLKTVVRRGRGLKPPVDVTRENTQRRLENELQELRLKLRVNDDLRISWLPDPSRKLDGEVKGRIIIVYNEDPDEAVETLRHEFLDFLLSRLLGSQQEVTNRLILLLNERAYREKEDLVEKLASLLR